MRVIDKHGREIAENLAKLNGEEMLNQKIVGQSADGVQLALSKFVAGQNNLELTVTGQGTLYSSANVTYYAEQESYSPVTEHFKIKRTYEKLTPRLEAETQSYVYDRDLTISNVKQGDYVLVTVEIDPKDDYRYVLVNDPLPAGFPRLDELPDSGKRSMAFQCAGPDGVRESSA